MLCVTVGWLGAGYRRKEAELAGKSLNVHLIEDGLRSRTHCGVPGFLVSAGFLPLLMHACPCLRNLPRCVAALVEVVARSAS